MYKYHIGLLTGKEDASQNFKKLCEVHLVDHVFWGTPENCELLWVDVSLDIPSTPSYIVGLTTPETEAMALELLQSGKIHSYIPLNTNKTTLLKSFYQAHQFLKKRFRYTQLFLLKKDHAFETSPMGMVFVSFESKLIKVNPALCRFLGYEAHELLDQPADMLSERHEYLYDQHMYTRLYDGEFESYSREKPYLHKDGHLVWGHMHVTLVKDEDGQSLCFLSQIQDITEQKSNIEKLKTNDIRWRELTASLEDLVYTTDKDLRYTQMYGPWGKVNRLTKEELLGRRIKDLDHPDTGFFLDKHLQALQGKHVEYTYTFESPTHPEQIVFATKLSPLISEKGEITGVLGVASDISSLKQAEEALTQNLQEKEILLQEVYHRVKNNLQVISSMLNLQARKTDNMALKQILNLTQNRVLSMALVHEKLYESKDLTHINYCEYVRDLGTQMAYSFGYNHHDVDIQYGCDTLYLDIDTSIACGLILNELLTNAFKHAFRQTKTKQKNKLWLNVEKKGEYAHLWIKDNGSGLPPHIDFYNSPSLGLKLVNGLSQQINAKLEYKNSPGLEVLIEIPLKEATP